MSHALSARTDPWIAKNRTSLEQALATIGKHLGTLEVMGEPAGAEVVVDGELVGTLPMRDTIRLPAGRITLEVRALGRASAIRDVTVVAETLARETVRLGPGTSPSTASRSLADTTLAANSSPTTDTASAVSVSTNSSAPASWQRPTAWALAGGALAFATGGVVGLMVRNGRADKYNGIADSGGCARDSAGQISGPRAAECSDLYEGGKTATLISVAAFSISAALAVTSGILFWRSDQPQRQVALLNGCTVGWSGNVSASCVLRF